MVLLAPKMQKCCFLLQDCISAILHFWSKKCFVTFGSTSYILNFWSKKYYFLYCWSQKYHFGTFLALSGQNYIFCTFAPNESFSLLRGNLHETLRFCFKNVYDFHVGRKVWKRIPISTLIAVHVVKKWTRNHFVRFPKTSFWTQSRCIKSLRSGKCKNRKIPPSISKAFYASRLSPIGTHSKCVQNVSKGIKKALRFH